MGSGKAGFESLDLTEPAPTEGFGQPCGEVVGDLGEPIELCRVRAQHWAADAGMFVLAGSAVGATAGAELDLAPLEVPEELGPLGIGGLPVLGTGSDAPPAGDEGSVVVDDVLVVDGDVALGGGQVLVAEELGGDVDGEPRGHRLGGEDAPEVMRGEPQGAPVGARHPGQSGQDRRAIEELLDPVVTDDLLVHTPRSLEEERQGRTVEPFAPS